MILKTFHFKISWPKHHSLFVISTHLNHPESDCQHPCPQCLVRSRPGDKLSNPRQSQGALGGSASAQLRYPGMLPGTSHPLSASVAWLAGDRAAHFFARYGTGPEPKRGPLRPPTRGWSRDPPMLRTNRMRAEVGGPGRLTNWTRPRGQGNRAGTNNSCWCLDVGKNISLAHTGSSTFHCFDIVNCKLMVVIKANRGSFLGWRSYKYPKIWYYKKLKSQINYR